MPKGHVIFLSVHNSTGDSKKRCMNGSYQVVTESNFEKGEINVNVVLCESGVGVQIFTLRSVY